MEHYSRGESTEEPLTLAQLPFLNLPEDPIWMKVKAGSRVANMVGYAKKQLLEHDLVLWSGSGMAINKTIQSAEMLKKAVKDLHQETHCCYRRSTEIWQPKESEALDSLKVNRDIPSIHILLSKTPLNPDNPSYQAPGQSAPFWSSQGPSTTTQTKKPTLASKAGPDPSAPAGHANLKKRKRRFPRQNGGGGNA